MTVLTMPVAPGQPATRRPVPWRNMLWVTWRQHRTMLISLTAVLGAFALFLLGAGLWVHHNFNALMACHPASSATCSALNRSFSQTDWTMGNTVDIFMNLAPALIGAFTGPAVLGRELESGTFRYAWTQGVGRLRWTVAKLVLLAVVIAVLAWAFSQLFAWFFDPFLTTAEMNVLAEGVFTTRGIAFAAWTLAAFSIGAFLGMLFRRVVPAMAVTLGAYLGVKLLAWLVLREDYPVSLVTSNVNQFAGQITPQAPWILKTWYTGPGGKPASQAAVDQVNSLFPQHGAPTVHATFGQELAQHGLTEWVRYIPVSRFWPMQFIEAGWLLILSALLMAATVWLARRRAA